MALEPLQLFDPRRTIQLQGLAGRAATTTIHDATSTGFQISGIFQAAEDFANVQLFSAYDYFNHLRVKPLPVTDLSGLTLQYDMEILPVNGEEGNVRPDGVRYATVGWDKLTITTGAGDIYEVPLMSHAQVVAGGYAPGSFGFSLHDRDAATLDELLICKPTPALTDKAYVYFMGTRWSCSSADAIAFCNLETRLLNNIGAANVPSCEQAIWWQDDPNFWHYLLVNNGGAGIQEAGAIDAADIASRLASMVGLSSWLVDCTASGNVITVTLETGVNGPVEVSTNSGSAPATLSRWAPGVYTAQVASSAEIRVGDYVGIDIGSANDEVVKVLAVGPGTFTANFTKPHYGKVTNIQCRVQPRARHFGRVLKNRMVDAPAPDYGEQPMRCRGTVLSEFWQRYAGCADRQRAAEEEHRHRDTHLNRHRCGDRQVSRLRVWRLQQDERHNKPGCQMQQQKSSHCPARASSVCHRFTFFLKQSASSRAAGIAGQIELTPGYSTDGSCSMYWPVPSSDVHRRPSRPASTPSRAPQ